MILTQERNYVRNELVAYARAKRQTLIREPPQDRSITGYVLVSETGVGSGGEWQGLGIVDVEIIGINPITGERNMPSCLGHFGVINRAVSFEIERRERQESMHYVIRADSNTYDTNIVALSPTPEQALTQLESLLEEAVDLLQRETGFATNRDDIKKVLSSPTIVARQTKKTNGQYELIPPEQRYKK